MRSSNTWLLTISAALAFSAPCAAAPATETAQRELRSAAASMDGAWNRADLSAFTTLFDENATIQAGPKSVLEGQEAIRNFFARDFSNRTNALRHVSEPQRIDQIAPDLALVDKLVRIEQQGANGGWTVLRTFLNSTLMRRVQGKWKVRTVRAHVVPNT